MTPPGYRPDSSCFRVEVVVDMEQPYGLGVQLPVTLWFTRAAARLYLGKCEEIVRNMLNFLLTPGMVGEVSRGGCWLCCRGDSGGVHAWM